MVYYIDKERDNKRKELVIMRPDNLELRTWKGLNVVDQYGRIYKQDPQTKELTRLPENKR